MNNYSYSNPLQVFGADRLLFGSDFPFVQQQKLPTECTNGEGEDSEGVMEPYEKYATIFQYWPLCQAALTPNQWKQIMSETTENLYGKFQ
jgi:predicted TIM-barrel fold metal-dependent hydrolase